MQVRNVRRTSSLVETGFTRTLWESPKAPAASAQSSRKAGRRRRCGDHRIAAALDNHD
jgi:hypothetical protein